MGPPIGGVRWLDVGSKQLEIGNLKTYNKNFFKKSTKKAFRNILFIYQKASPSDNQI